MDLLWLPAAARALGITVNETAGWRSRSHGPLLDLNVVQHHDASPAGDSPGGLTWMVSNYARSSAQLRVNRQGVLEVVGSGIAYHAGNVNNPSFSNPRSVGIETDLTINETITAACLQTLRLVTALILARAGKTAAYMSMHKSVCVPAGRKVDPYGLDLAAERVAVQTLIDQIRGGAAPGTVTDTATQEDFLMALSQYDQELTRNCTVETVETVRRLEAMLRGGDPRWDRMEIIESHVKATLEAVTKGDAEAKARLEQIYLDVSKMLADTNEGDVDQLADRLIESFGDDLAARLVTTIGEKLAS